MKIKLKNYFYQIKKIAKETIDLIKVFEKDRKSMQNQILKLKQEMKILNKNNNNNNIKSLIIPKYSIDITSISQSNNISE